MTDGASLAHFLTRGWARFPAEPRVAAWAAAARAEAEALMAAPDADFRCGGTWFPGVNLLPNDADGAVNGTPFQGWARDFVEEALGLRDFAWDRAQISAVFPRYPQPGPEETPAAARYRLTRDAAHVDGLLRLGDSRRRHFGEAHGFVLGAPLTPVAEGASPMSVWEGSHEHMRRAFEDVFALDPPERWAERDVTEAYQAARRVCFDRCRRIEIPAQPGETYIVHRLALHGVAPWRGAGSAAATPRVIAYFRPNPFPRATPDWWLSRP